MNTHIRTVFDSVYYAVLRADNAAEGLHTQDLLMNPELMSDFHRLSLGDTSFVMLRQLLPEMLRRNAECGT
jgi:hypothetical protein